MPWNRPIYLCWWVIWQLGACSPVQTSCRSVGTLRLFQFIHGMTKPMHGETCELEFAQRVSVQGIHNFVLMNWSFVLQPYIGNIEKPHRTTYIQPIHNLIYWSAILWTKRTVMQSLSTWKCRPKDLVAHLKDNNNEPSTEHLSDLLSTLLSLSPPKLEHGRVHCSPWRSYHQLHHHKNICGGSDASGSSYGGATQFRAASAISFLQTFSFSRSAMFTIAS